MLCDARHSAARPTCGKLNAGATTKITMPTRSAPSRFVEELHGVIIVWDQDG
jgi:hypothetical protein